MLYKTIGLLIKRKNIINPIIKDLHKELLFYIFELQLTLKSIEKLEIQNLRFFDSKVGDRKCQTRASFILDLLKKNQLNDQNYIKKLKHDLSQHIAQLQHILLNINFEGMSFTQDIINKFKYASLSDFIDSHNINIFIPKDLIFFTLCFLTTYLSENELESLIKNTISSTRIKKFKALAKIELCKLSIEYEQTLAKIYLPKDQPSSLNQIELKKFSSISIFMTPLFPSMKAIFEKIKKEQEHFLIQRFILCTCGGIIRQTYNVFAYDFLNNQFQEIPLKKLPSKMTVMIFEGYFFNGSWAMLKNTLNIPAELYPDATCLQKICNCNPKSSYIPSKINLENVILAGFVQHPQFITNAEIDWKGLGLEDSDLKKEFDYLKTIPGCSIDDMSTFCIRHVYASTIADVLKEQEEMEARLQAK